MLNGYTPSFTSFNGGLYEMEMVRSAIHAKARLMAKLKFEIVGTKYQSLEKVTSIQAKWVSINLSILVSCRNDPWK